MEERDVQRVAEEAAKKAIHQTFRLLGVDVKDQRSVNDFRADLVHARKMRRLWEGAGGKITMGVLVAMLVAGLVAASDWIKAAFGMRGL